MAIPAWDAATTFGTLSPSQVNSRLVRDAANLFVQYPTGFNSSWLSGRALSGHSAGIYQWEITVTTLGNAGPYVMMGMSKSTASFVDGYHLQLDANSTSPTSNIIPTAGLVYTMVADLDAHTLKVYKNGVLSYSGSLTAATTWYPAVSLVQSSNVAAMKLTANFGATAFAYPISNDTSLVGSIFSENTAGANLTSGTVLSGSSTSIGSVNAALLASVLLLGAPQSVNSVTGNLSTSISLAGGIQATTGVSGELNGLTHIFGGIQSMNTVTGTLSTSISLAGFLQSVNTLSAKFGLPVVLLGSVSSVQTANGVLTTRTNLAGLFGGSNSLSGSLTNNNIKELQVSFYDPSNVPITGASSLISIIIRQDITGLYLDLDPVAFGLKNSGWVKLSDTLTQVDAINAKGLYKYLLNLGVLPDGDYLAMIEYAGASPLHAKIPFTLKNGKTLEQWLADVIGGRLPTYLIGGLMPSALVGGVLSLNVEEHNQLMAGATQASVNLIPTTPAPTAAQITSAVWANPDAVKMRKIATNKKITDPVTGIMTVYEDGSTAVAFTAQLWEDAAGTIKYRGQGFERIEVLA
jgi:hypothetical protein